MNQLAKVFQYHGSQVRTVIKNEEPWFVLSDVCKVLGLSTPSRVKERLGDGVSSTHTISDSLHRNQTVTIINEDGLYDVILESRKPEARSFRKWITSEVLPSIRKTGQYSLNQPSYSIDDPIKRAEKWIEEQKERQTLQLQNAQKEQIIHELQPKATYYDLILQNKSVMAISKIAKDYGMSATRMNKLLHELGVQYKQGDCWLLYQKHADKGYTQSKTHVLDEEKSKLHTYWTQKGRLFIYELLKREKQIIPIIEREGEVHA